MAMPEEMMMALVQQLLQTSQDQNVGVMDLLGANQPNRGVRSVNPTPNTQAPARPDINRRVSVELGTPEVVDDPNKGAAAAAGTDELMKMLLASLLDPKIKADEVGSQLMQRLTMDSMSGGGKGSSPQGVAGFLKQILGNMAAEQAPNQKGQR